MKNPKKMIKKASIAFLSTMLLMTASVAHSQAVKTEGHTDYGVAYDPDLDEWDIHIHDEVNLVEYSPPTGAVLYVKPEAHTTVPNDPAYSFLGTAGSDVWILPKAQDPALLFLGFGAEEIADGTFKSNQFTIHLRQVVGPGNFTIYDQDSFGNPVLWMSSADGISSNDFRVLPSGAHSHVNSAFSKPGAYTVYFEAMAYRESDGQFTTSGLVPYQFYVAPAVTNLDHQHMDFRLEYDPAATGSNQLYTILGYDNGTISARATNQQVYIVGGTNSQLTIPNNPNYTFLGTPGSPIWILPQSQDLTLPYVGTSAEDIPLGVFTNALSLQLTRVEGPGNFFAWANSGVGQAPIIKMICTNGVIPPDFDHMSPLTGSHEHYNWGFSSNGLYRLTFRVTGQRVGEATNIIGRETTWALQILPLRPYEKWVATNWFPGTGANVVGPSADPDGDGVPNIFEYAMGGFPDDPFPPTLPAFTFVTDGGTNYGALTFTKADAATDATLTPVVSDTLGATANWQPISTVFEVITNALDGNKTYTIRDAAPVTSAPHRFYKLNATLTP
jgi:surface-anchored protein